MSGIEEARREVVSALDRLRSKGSTPILVALDGPSGSGKSTLASLVAEDTGGVLVQSDDFYSAHIPDSQWDIMSSAAKVDLCINWRRLRTEALEPLLDGRKARWKAFDVDNPLSGGTYPLQEAWTECASSSIVVLDGVYSARPELDDLLSLKVLVHVPSEVRNARLAEREEPSFLAAWHERWDAAEAYYFINVCPCSSFDIVVRV
ncbi:MAG: AAA family ATPase [Candidatus Latescibacteria bacterium]|nr:AAA family ATPase [Candidatus Latescibacterota bacterium]